MKKAKIVVRSGVTMPPARCQSSSLAARPSGASGSSSAWGGASGPLIGQPLAYERGGGEGEPGGSPSVSKKGAARGKHGFPPRERAGGERRSCLPGRPSVCDLDARRAPHE